jgi:hypothetical protein
MELHYQIGYNYELQDDLEIALVYFQKALNMFDLKNDEVYTAFIQKKIDAIVGREGQKP